MPTSRNRDYSAPPDTYHNVSALYGWNDTVIISGGQIPTTGAWRAVTISENGYLNVNATLSMSGGVTINTDPIVNAQVTGNNYLASISGDVRFLRTGSASVSISNPVLAVSGNVFAQNPIGVTGTRTDNASGYAANNFLMGGGRAVEVASGFNPQYASGANAMFNIDRVNGSLLTENTDLNYNYDSVIAYPPQSTIVSNSTVSGSFAATALQTGIAIYANSGRKNWFIQNTSNTNPLYVKLGAPPVTTGSFNLILNPSSSAGQGGGSFSDNQYLGDISISGTSFVAWELA